jgi:hypothetical protein
MQNETTLAPIEGETPKVTPSFAPADLAHFAALSHLKAPDSFNHLAIGLIRLAQEPGEFGYGDGTEGHFSFCNYAQSAVETRALLRLTRAALDYLEADYLACEAAQMHDCRNDLATFEALREGGDVSATRQDGGSVPPIEPPTVAPAADDDAEPSAWPAIAQALRELAQFAEAVADGRAGDYTSEIGAARELGAALELGRKGVGFLRDELREEIERATEWRRKDIEAFSALDILKA